MATHESRDPSVPVIPYRPPSADPEEISFRQPGVIAFLVSWAAFIGAVVGDPGGQHLTRCVVVILGGGIVGSLAALISLARAVGMRRSIRKERFVAELVFSALALAFGGFAVYEGVGLFR